MKLNSYFDRIRDLVQDFCKTTGQRVGIFDEEFNLILESKEHSDFCRIIRRTSEGRRRCQQCDVHGLKTVKSTKKRYVFRCHAGLWEAYAPILFDEKIIGYMGFGQLLYKDNFEVQWQNTLSRCQDIVNNENELLSAFKRLKTTTPDYISSAAHVMAACVSSIRLEYMLIENNTPLIDRIFAYINNNITGELSLKTLSSEMNVSVSTLCRVVKENGGKRVGALISEERIRLAKEYLTSTDYSVSRISMLVGLENYNYFSRMFKKQTGNTPLEFRKKNKFNITKK